jgi:hypothetical protein
LLTVKVARGFAALASVTRLWVWCDVTRAAMRYVISIPGLKVLDVLYLRPPGRLAGFAEATALEVFRSYWLNDRDLIEIASCRSLRELAAQYATLTMPVLDALLDLPRLQSLDLEGSNINDSFAKRLSASRSLCSLDLGATQLTGKGLKYICRMRQLRSLDLWASKIIEADIELLADLPHLEYLAIGQVEGEAVFSADTLLPRLRAIRSLKRIWLDGIGLSQRAKRQLERRYKTVRITS